MGSLLRGLDLALGMRRCALRIGTHGVSPARVAPSCGLFGLTLHPPPPSPWHLHLSTRPSGCQYVYNVYDDGTDSGFFMCNDRINALIVEVISRDNVFEAVLGCQDKFVRIIQVRTLRV